VALARFSLRLRHCVALNGGDGDFADRLTEINRPETNSNEYKADDRAAGGSRSTLRYTSPACLAVRHCRWDN